MEKIREISIKREEDLLKVASILTPFLEKSSHILLYGDLGAGKTTLVKYIIENIAENESVSSPTYSIINEYDTSIGSIAHIDLYRLDSYEEALDIGIEDYLDKHICIVEWPQIIESIIENYVTVNITLGNEGERIFKINSESVDL